MGPFLCPFQGIICRLPYGQDCLIFDPMTSYLDLDGNLTGEYVTNNSVSDSNLTAEYLKTESQKRY